MPFYEWKRFNEETQEWDFELTDHYATPPDSTGQWQRVYSVGIGQVQGAGGSPARTVKPKKEKDS